MSVLAQIYRTGLSLLTDLYELTMAYGYWKLGRGDRRAVFHLFFRRPPFEGGYAIAAGLGTAMEFVESFRFEDEDLQYLGSLGGNDGRPLFEPEFLEYLRGLRLDCDIQAMPEGTLAFGGEPLVRVCGPILQCQLLETALLNIINFQTLIATKAARICGATDGQPVIEFGLRRAQGIDGGLAASRAAYIGGCSATSNVLAGRLYGIPVKGTIAHSWVMSFDTEREALEGYARSMPNNCLLIVDTYDTLQGVRLAVRTGQQLRQRGYELAGVRLDSGDLAYLSSQARRILDEGGLPGASIVASNDLDEQTIESLKHQGAAIDVWGVGTRLVTAYDQPALGGVYKLGAVEAEDGSWQPKIKVSEQLLKSSVPGMLQVRRYQLADNLVGDMIFDEFAGVDARRTIVDPADATRRKTLPAGTPSSDLLVPVLRQGKLVGGHEGLATIRARVQSELDRLHPSVRRLLNPHEYPVGLDIGLHERRAKMIQRERERAET